jgi:hypothetical protein
MRKRSGVGALACGLLLAAAPAALADGEVVESKVSVKQKGAITKKRDAKATLAWSFEISKPDGSRADSLHQAQLSLPKGVYANPKGLQACSLDALNRNDPNSCPAKSKVGTGTAHISTPEVRAEPFASTSTIYYIGKQGRNPAFAAYYTLTEIPSLHSVSQMIVTRSGNRSKLLMDQVPIPVPGLPDSTPLDISVGFAKGKPFWMSARCKRGSKSATRYGFYPTSPASHDNSVFHTSLSGGISGSARAC